jgi:glucokinase
MICISVGNSVSAGILVDGRLIRGADDSAGELGHTTVKDDVLRCTCGNRGCLELYVTLQIIQNTARRELTRFRGYSILRSALNDPSGSIPPEAIHTAALHGDKIAIKLLGDCADTLGIAVANVVNIFNPRLVLLGGSVIEAFPQLLPDVERVVRLRSMISNQQRLLIRPASLGANGPLIGAGLQVIHKFLDL